jgi:hypothetical protein
MGFTSGSQWLEDGATAGDGDGALEYDHDDRERSEIRQSGGGKYNDDRTFYAFCSTSFVLTSEITVPG